MESKIDNLEKTILTLYDSFLSNNELIDKLAKKVSQLSKQVEDMSEELWMPIPFDHPIISGEKSVLDNLPFH